MHSGMQHLIDCIRGGLLFSSTYCFNGDLKIIFCFVGDWVVRKNMACKMILGGISIIFSNDIVKYCLLDYD